MKDPKEKDKPEFHSAIPHPADIGRAMEEITNLLYEDLEHMLIEAGIREKED